jgi:hypothetical protein
MRIIHGARDLPAVIVDSYNIELRDGGQFLGDRVNKRAFQAMMTNWRQRVDRSGEDPLDGRPTEELYRDKRELERILLAGDPESAGVLLGAIEEFARELAAVVRRLLGTAEWRGTQCIAVGGGFREGRVGELAIGRASVMVKAEGVTTSLLPLRHHPEEAGLIGGLHLAPPEMLTAFQGILAADIGGSNVRTAIVEAELEDGSVAGAHVWGCELWRHADSKSEKELLLQHMVERLRHAASLAEQEGVRLAPFIAIGCPGIIGEDGVILRGSQNLPGPWNGFNLAAHVAGALPRVAGRDSVVFIHNDAVMQGLSELPFMRGVKHWGVLTIGTGLGNARFTNR